MEYFEPDLTSQGLKKLVAVLNIHQSDECVVNSLYELCKINISQNRVLQIRQKTGDDAKKYQENLIEEKIFNSPLKTSEIEITPNKAIGLDEGKVLIRSATVDEVTGKYDRKWRNVKFGVGYPFDENGKKDGFAQYTAEVACVLNEFEKPFKELIMRTGFLLADNQAALSDGGNGYDTFLEQNCPNAIRILDAYHLKEHIWVLAKLLYKDNPDGTPAKNAIDFVALQYETLKEKGFKNFITSIQIFKADIKRNQIALWEKEINYFMKNENRLDYPLYIQKKLPLGSGVVEGGIKHICNKRLKLGSACWLLKNANGILKLRITWCNNDSYEFWNWRDKQFLRDKPFLKAS